MPKGSRTPRVATAASNSAADHTEEDDAMELDPANNNGHSGSSPAGTILHLAMKNFMTFRDVALTPGLGFNVVVGPNGSGKSTIVSALTVGLGGDLSTLRRQKRLSDLVRSDGGPECDEAEVRVRLQGRGEGGAIEVRCTIAKRGGGMASYWVDGKVSSKKVVSSLARSLQIQTDNLCQFLPQDVVREFPQMTGSRVFHSTVRAVGDQETLNLHQELVDIREKCKQMQAALQDKEATRDRLEKAHRETDKVLAGIKQRETIENLQRLLEKRRQYLEVFRMKDEYIRKVKEEKEAMSRETKAKENYDRLKEELDDYLQEKAKLQANIKSKTDVLAKVARPSHLNTVTAKGDEVDDINQRIQAVKNNAKLKRAQVNKLKKSLVEKRKQLAELRARGLKEQKAQLEKEKNALEHQDAVLRADKAEREREARCNEVRKEERERERNGLLSVEVRMLNLLKKKNSDAHAGVMWMKNNSEMGHFERPIHNPLMLTIQPREASYGHYVERLVGKSDLETFVCESASDTSKLINALRKGQNLRKINVVHSSPNSGRHQPLSRDQIQANLRNHLIDFVIDMIDCPEAVKSYLCEKKGFHRVPVFSVSVNSKEVSKFFDRYFIDNKFYIVKRRRYEQGHRTNIVDMSNDEAHCFAESPDRQRIQELDKQIREYSNIATRLRAEAATHGQDLDKLLLKKTEKSVLFESLLGQLGQMSSVEREVSRIERDIATITKSPASSQSSLRKHFLDRKVAVRKLTQALLPLHVNVRDGVDALVAELQFKVALEKLEVNGGKDAELKAAEKDWNQLREHHDNLLKNVEQRKAALIDARKKLEWENMKKFEMSLSMREELDEHTPQDLGEVKERIRETEDDLARLPDYSQAQRKHALEMDDKLKQSKTELDELTRRTNVVKMSSKSKNDELTKRVKDLVDKIDSKFSYLMGAFGNTGAVELEGNSMDEGNDSEYKMVIKVKFDDGPAPLQRLSASVQSGGEKSVVTALYMMALQELTRVPFRCVDEINQGMDDKNERMMWRQLMETAAKYSAQYFYLAPKFPRQLDFNDDVTVILCQNGAASKRRAELDIDAAIDQAKKRARRR